MFSVPLVLGWEAALKRPDNLAAAGIDRVDVDTLIDRLVERALRVDLHFLWRPQAFDPDDEIVLQTAVNGFVEMIVSFDTKDLRCPAMRFGIEVDRPAEALTGRR